MGPLHYSLGDIVASSDGKLSIGQAIAVGVNTTSPAYSLAAVLGVIVAYVHFAAPIVILISFVPMFLTSLSFMYLNRRDPDCGTTFSWVTRAIGARSGFLAGWVIAATGVLLIGSLAETAVIYGLTLFGAEEAAENQGLVVGLAALVIVIMVGLAVMGSDSSIKLQVVVSVSQVAILVIFGVGALWAFVSSGGLGAFAATSTGEVLTTYSGPGLAEWLNPLAQGADGFVAAALLAVFLFWGIESATNLSEECRRPSDAGKASVLSIVLLLTAYTIVAISVVLYMWTTNGFEAGEDPILVEMAPTALGGFGFLIILGVAISALASTQSTLVPGSRAVLSMARRGALPSQLGLMHPRWKTPFISYSVLSIAALAVYVPLALLSPNALIDVLSSLGMLVALYYTVTAISCAVFYRSHVKSSLKGFIMLGALPVVGAAGLLTVLVMSVRSFMVDPEMSASGGNWLGVPPPVFIAGAVVGSGLVVMLIRSIVAPRFFRSHDAVSAGRHQSPFVAVDSAHLPKGGVVVDCNTDASAVARLCAEAVMFAEPSALPVYLVFGTMPPEYAGEEYEATVSALEDQGRMLFAYGRSILVNAGVTLVFEVLVPESAVVSVEQVAADTEASRILSPSFSIAE